MTSRIKSKYKETGKKFEPVLKVKSYLEKQTATPPKALLVQRKPIELKEKKTPNADIVHTDIDIMERSASTLNMSHNKISTPVFNPKDEDEY